MHPRRVLLVLAIRPFQFDPTFQSLFTTPNHPSYPSAHSCLSGASAEVLAYLFPYAANSVRRTAEQAGEARIWAGLHFRNDIDAGEHLAQQVGAKVIAAVKGDDVKK